jgi:hypothetical protein
MFNPQAARERCEAGGRQAFEEWANANARNIHVDALDEAAMGFKAGWEAARSDLPAALEALEEAQGKLEALGYHSPADCPSRKHGGYPGCGACAYVLGVGE